MHSFDVAHERMRCLCGPAPLRFCLIGTIWAFRKTSQNRKAYAYVLVLEDTNMKEVLQRYCLCRTMYGEFSLAEKCDNDNCRYSTEKEKNLVCGKEKGVCFERTKGIVHEIHLLCCILEYIGTSLARRAAAFTVLLFRLWIVMLRSGARLSSRELPWNFSSRCTSGRTGTSNFHPPFSNVFCYACQARSKLYAVLGYWYCIRAYNTGFLRLHDRIP